MMMNCENLDLVAASLAQLDVSTLLSSLSPTEISKDHQRRKRRRGEVANPSNTLDALVAKKADEQPFEKRYLSEQEAIEGPDDETEMKKMELDPDVSTRTCSTCGYQGKWVSEMIRHKRVHTSERPFKCRYCSRTSKWKADLIRHVAKTHGIRVVSKYSRSKVFTSHHNSHESSPEVSSTSSEKRTVTYRCQICNFEDDRVSVLNHHVAIIHQTSPCVCRCGIRFEDVQSALAHSSISPIGCTNGDIIFNIMPSYEKSPLSPSCRSETSSDSGIHTDPEEEAPRNLSSFTNTPLLLSPTVSVPPTPLIPDLQSALMSIQSSPLMSLYLASLLQSTLINNNNTDCNNFSTNNNNNNNNDSTTVINNNNYLTLPTTQDDDLVDVEM